MRQWIGIYGNAFCRGMRYKEGVKAQYALSQVEGGSFLLLSMPSKLAFWGTSERCPEWGYTCNAPQVPDLGSFCNLDFVMPAADFSWTMVYTHEDFTLGGPYFAERDWLAEPGGEAKPENRRARRRR
jgi:hypothetical protein